MSLRIESLPSAGRALSLFLPVAIAMIVQVTVMAPLREERSTEVLLEKVRAGRAAELETLFAATGYPWPLQGTVPRFALRHVPSDLDEQTVELKKSLFFRLALPLVVAENERVQRQRELLQALFARGVLLRGSREYRLATRLAREYEVAGDVNALAVRELLLRRVDTIPVALALAQAADESAWGTSRFSREGNSLFGQWTWVRGEGLVPLRRAPGKGHLVRSFSSLRESVRAYFYNLNVGHAYGGFRHLREEMRRAGQPLDASVLAGGLGRYSERGMVYVEEIRGLMQDNDLLALGDSVVLR